MVPRSIQKTKDVLTLTQSLAIHNQKPKSCSGKDVFGKDFHTSSESDYRTLNNLGSTIPLRQAAEKSESDTSFIRVDSSDIGSFLKHIPCSKSGHHHDCSMLPC